MVTEPPIKVDSLPAHLDWIAIPKSELKDPLVCDLPRFKLKSQVDFGATTLIFYEHMVGSVFETPYLTNRIKDSSFQFRWRNAKLSVSTDELGKREIFMFNIGEEKALVSSNIFLMLRFLKKEQSSLKLTLDVGYWNAMLSGDSFLSYQPMTRRTGISGIQRLLLYEKCLFHWDGSFSRSSNTRTDPASIEYCCQALLDQQRTPPPFCTNFDEYLNISGGKDSRAVLKLLSQARSLKDIDFYHQPRGEKICDALSILIAQKFQKTLTSPKRIWSPISFKESLEVFLESTSGRTFNYIPTTRIACDGFQCSMHHMGGFGEVYRYPLYLSSLRKIGVQVLPTKTKDLAELLARTFAKGYSSLDSRVALRNEIQEGLSIVAEEYQTSDPLSLLVGHYALFRNRDHFQGNNKLRAICNKQAFSYPLASKALTQKSVQYYNSNKWTGNDEIFTRIVKQFPVAVSLPYDRDINALDDLGDCGLNGLYQSWFRQHRQARQMTEQDRYSVDRELSAFKEAVDELTSSDINLDISWDRFISGTIGMFNRGLRTRARSSFLKVHVLNRFNQMIL